MSAGNRLQLSSVARKQHGQRDNGGADWQHKAPPRRQGEAALGNSLPRGRTAKGAREADLDHTQANARLAGAAGGHAGEDGSSGLLLSSGGGGRRAETCAAPPCGIPSSLYLQVVVMVAEAMWFLQRPSPWRAAPRPPAPPSTRPRQESSARVKYRQLTPADLEAERGTRLASRWSADHSQLSWSLLVSGAVLYSARAACTATMRSASSAGVTAIVESDSCECSEPL